MSEHEPDELDVKLAALEREAEPARDLWPGIAAAIAEQPPLAARPPLNVRRLTQPAPRIKQSRIWALAASVLLMVASSAVTYLILQRSMDEQIAQARRQTAQELPPVIKAIPASFGYQQLGPEYAQAHADLDARSARYLASLPPAERTQFEQSLADLRRAASELSAQLAEHPSDPLLQELLLSTYQNELGLLTRANDLGASTSLGADL
jgi:hypothetical protein